MGGGGGGGGAVDVRPEGLFADVSLDYPFALLAGDVAAPVVLAVAALHQFLGVGVVASPTAHQLTAVAAHGRLVALPGSRGERGSSGLGTMATEILKTQLMLSCYLCYHSCFNSRSNAIMVKAVMHFVYIFLPFLPLGFLGRLGSSWKQNSFVIPCSGAI